METPICKDCDREQHGIVEFRGNHGRVTFECSYCGAINDAPEVSGREIPKPATVEQPPPSS